MAKHLDRGREGEALAADFLEQQGYTVIARNWRSGKAELDLILRHEATLVFCEVKTRRNSRFGFPEEHITAKKRALMIQAAGFYLEEVAHEGEFRFDIIAITIEPQLEIHHQPDAFFPGL